MTVHEQPRTVSAPIDRPHVAEEHPFKPVKVLAAVGVLALIVEALVIGGWIAGPHFKQTPVGPSPVPTYMKAGLTGLTVIGLLAWLACMWYFLIRPWRREGRITVDGMFAITFVLIYWLDPFGDWVVPQFTYNSWLWNRGSWLPEAGSLMPNSGRIPEPVFLTGPLYLWCIFGVAVAANILMRRAKSRWPQLGTFGMVAGTVGCFIVWDLFWELTFIRIGYWTYPTTPHWLTIFGGSWYRINLTEPIAWGTTWAAFALLRYFKDDKGRTIAERGVDQLRASNRNQSLLRFLAIYGTCNIFFLLFYIIPTNAIAIHGDTWPKDTLKRSYFTDGLCGPGTSYACPSQGTPIPRPKSGHVNPAGQLVPGEVPVSPLPPVTFATK